MTTHKPVLPKETIENLNLKKGDIVVDATLGGGGHGREIMKRIGDSGVYIGIDLDESAINKFFAEIPNSKSQISNSKIQKTGNIIIVNDNFANLEKVLEILKIKKANAILADLGWSSDQLEGRGMSFLYNEELDMRYDCNQKLTAKKIVNEYFKEDLGKIIREYGEEKFYKNIAKAIVESRKKKDIRATQELAEIIRKAVPEKYQQIKINPATRTFQAIRIEVNQELENLKKFIPDAIEKLKTGGRLGIISFHSLEDRIVKNIFRDNAGGCTCPPNFPRCVCGKTASVKIITKRPIIPGEAEIKDNSRARSAKLRICEKL